MSIPYTQKAIVQSRYGEPVDVLSMSSSHPVIPPTATQLQVQVHAASVNPADVKLCQGKLAFMIKLTFPHVPGCDLAGMVVAVGRSVTHFKLGDRVMADQFKAAGGYQQYVNLEEDSAVAHAPRSLPFDQIACLPMAAETAASALQIAQLKPGQKVVIVGASGGVGHFAVQIAKLMGASSVVGVTSGKNRQFVMELGCDSVVDYTEQTMSEALHKEYDVVVDTVGGVNQWTEAQKVLKRKGDDPATRFSIARLPGFIGRQLVRKLYCFFGEQHAYSLHFLTPQATGLEQVSKWADKGLLKVNVDREFQFTAEDVKAMYAHSAAGRTKGKTTLIIVPLA